MSVPVLEEAVVAIELQLVSLIIKVLLKSIAGMVTILCLVVGYLNHEDLWSIWLTLHFSYIVFDLLNQYHIPVILMIILVQYDYAKTLWVSSEFDKRFHCVDKL